MLRSLFVADAAPAIRTESVLPQCGACGYYRTCKSPKISVSGGGARKLLVVGRFPDSDADRKNAGNLSAAAMTLRTVMGKYGYRLEKDTWWTDAMICKPNGKTKVDQAVDYCRPNLIKTIQLLKPKVILLLGSEAVMSFFGWVWKPGEGGVYRFRGFRVPNRRTNAWVVPTWHPATLLQERDPVLDRQFQEDVKAALEYAHPGSARPYPPDKVPPETEDGAVEVVKSTREAAARIRSLTARAKRKGWAVAFDFETTCLKPEGPKSEIVSCAVCFGGEETVAYPWDRRTMEATKELLEDPEIPKVGANDKFEHRWCLANGIRVRGWCWDVNLTAHALWNNSKIRSITAVDFQAVVELGVAGWDREVHQFMTSDKGKGCYQPNRLRQADINKVLLYNGLDALYEYQIYLRQLEHLGMTRAGAEGRD